MGLDISFWILAIVVIVAALAVVSVKNVFHAALALILTFVAVAGIYITLSADFLAAVQILVYVGAISVLIILSVMLTREVQRERGTGSRVTVRKRVLELVEEGIVEKAEGHSYRLKE